MRPILQKHLDVLVFLAVPALLPAQKDLGYGPANATSVIDIHLDALRSSHLGDALGAANPWIKAVLDARGIKRVHLASVLPAHDDLRVTWLAHLQGPAIDLPSRMEAVAVPLKASQWKSPDILRYRALSPQSGLLGTGPHLLATGGKPVAGAPAATAEGDVALRATVNFSDPKSATAPLPLIGLMPFPLLEGVRYATDPPRRFTATVQRQGQGRALLVEVELQFHNGQSIDGLLAALRERVARTMHSAEHFALHASLHRLEVDASAKEKRVTVRFAIPDRRTAEAIAKQAKTPILTMLSVPGLSGLLIAQERSARQPKPVLRTVIEMENEEVVEEEKSLEAAEKPGGKNTPPAKTKKK